MHDALGRLIKVGDYIVYPQRSGSSMWLTLGYVTRIKTSQLAVERINLDQARRPRIKRAYMTHGHRAIVVGGDTIPERYRSIIEGARVRKQRDNGRQLYADQAEALQSASPKREVIEETGQR